MATDGHWAIREVISDMIAAGVQPSNYSVGHEHGAPMGSLVVPVWGLTMGSDSVQLVRPPATIAFSWGSHNSNFTMVYGIYNHSYWGL